MNIIRAPLKRRTVIGLLLAVLLGPTVRSVAAAEIDSSHLQALGEVAYHDWRSPSLGRRFHVFVDLPENYANSDEPYPAVYLLDGGNSFPLVSALQHYLRFGDEAPPLLLVGISYGADTFREGNWRQTDFTAEAEEPGFWGGAGAFQSALAGELIPLIEAHYRADPRRRILFGHSLGGQFVLYSSLTRPELFFGHIASNPVLSRNLDFFLDYRGPGEAPARATRLFVAMAEFERDELRPATQAWRRHWEQVSCPPWRWTFRILPGQSHLSAVPESFRHGIDWLLAAGHAPP